MSLLLDLCVYYRGTGPIGRYRLYVRIMIPVDLGIGTGIDMDIDVDIDRKRILDLY